MFIYSAPTESSRVTICFRWKRNSPPVKAIHPSDFQQSLKESKASSSYIRNPQAQSSIGLSIQSQLRTNSKIPPSFYNPQSCKQMAALVYILVTFVTPFIFQFTFVTPFIFQFTFVTPSLCLMKKHKQTQHATFKKMLFTLKKHKQTQHATFKKMLFT